LNSHRSSLRFNKRTIGDSGQTGGLSF
jgi:hypothetical protein